MGAGLESAGALEFDDNSFSEIPSLTELNSAILPVIVSGPELFQCVGTAFNISPDGILITAQHVVAEAIDICSRHRGSAIHVLMVHSGEDCDDISDLLGGLVPVCDIVHTTATDVALLQIRILHNGAVFPLPILRLASRLPALGTRILGLGYTKMAVGSDEVTVDARTLTIEQGFHATTGKVVQIYPNGRDSFMLPSPCFETSARFDAGMSGGPVMNEDGFVCGIVSSSIDGGDAESGYVSWASAAFLVYLLHVNVPNGKMSVHSLVDAHMIATDEYFDELDFEQLEDGRVNIRFRFEGPTCPTD